MGLGSEPPTHILNASRCLFRSTFRMFAKRLSCCVAAVISCAFHDRAATTCGNRVSSPRDSNPEHID
jgi:hypothetical protein